MERLKIPPCAIGTLGWGSGMNGAKTIFGKTENISTLKETFRRACGLGFDLWDVSPVYGSGSAEEILGKCIAERNKRDGNIIISTKFMPRAAYKYGDAIRSLDGSLSRLNINRADIYWLSKPIHTDENMREFARLMRRGKIRAAGVSNHDLEQIIYADNVLKEEGAALGAVQNHFSLIRRDSEQLKIIDWCHSKNIPYFAYMVLEQGALSGKYDEKHRFPVLSLRGLVFNGKLKRLSPLTEYLKELGKKYSVSPSQIPIAWAISKGTVPVVGLTAPQYADDLNKGADLILEETELSRLESLSAESGIESRRSWEK